jgi:hypothetical protein
MNTAALREQLIVLLGSLAGYNDKGFEWSGHSSARVEDERAKAQAELESLVSRIGEANLPAAFVQALRSGEVARDASGRFHNLVRRG